MSKALMRDQYQSLKPEEKVVFLEGGGIIYDPGTCSSPESRANDAAFTATASVAGSMWAYWGEPEIAVYMAVYKATLKYERDAINEKYYDEARAGTI